MKYLLALTLRVEAGDEEEARRRFRQQLTLTDIDELLDRTYVEELLGYLYGDGEEMTLDEMRARLGVAP